MTMFKVNVSILDEHILVTINKLITPALDINRKLKPYSRN